MSRQPTMREEGYRFIRWSPGGGVVVGPIEGGPREELWAARKGHASAGFHWRGTDWEFCGTLTDDTGRYTGP